MQGVSAVKLFWVFMALPGWPLCLYFGMNTFQRADLDRNMT